jgi:hypothetical protein
VVKKGVVTLLLVLVLTAVFAVCLVSASQLLAPRDMPFGVTGSSPVISDVQDKISLDLIHYSNESDLIDAAKRGDIDGGYIPGASSDTIVTVPAKSFFGEIYVRGGFTDTAKRTPAKSRRRWLLRFPRRTAPAQLSDCCCCPRSSAAT